MEISIVEAMKTEVPVTASAGGVVERIVSTPGTLVNAGHPIVLIKEEVMA